MMLAPVYLLDGYNGNIGEDTDYILAQKDGYFGRDCSRYHHDCPASLFSVSLGLLPCLHLSIKWFNNYFLDHLAFKYCYFYDFSTLMEMITVITRTEDLHMQITPMTTLIQIILKMKFFRLINWRFSNDLDPKQPIISVTSSFSIEENIDSKIYSPLIYYL